MLQAKIESFKKRQGKRRDPIPQAEAPFHHGFHRLDRFPSFMSRSDSSRS